MMVLGIGGQGGALGPVGSILGICFVVFGGLLLCTCGGCSNQELSRLCSLGMGRKCWVCGPLFDLGFLPWLTH